MRQSLFSVKELNAGCLTFNLSALRPDLGMCLSLCGAHSPCWSIAEENITAAENWTMLTHVTVQGCPDIRKRTVFWGLPIFSRLSFWEEKYCNEDEYGVLVEWYWRGKTEVRGEKTVPVPFFSTLILQGMTWDRTKPLEVTIYDL